MHSNHLCYIFAVYKYDVQVLREGIVLEDKNVNGIFKIMTNNQAMHILQVTMNTAKSASEISIESGIPLTQVYRWVHRLHNLGLVRISGDTNSSGKKYFMYQSKIKSIKVTLNSSF